MTVRCARPESKKRPKLNLTPSRHAARVDLVVVLGSGTACKVACSVTSSGPGGFGRQVNDIPVSQELRSWKRSCLYPTYIKGQAYFAAGQAPSAAGEFQKILDHSGLVWNCWTGALAHLGVARVNALEAKTHEGSMLMPRGRGRWRLTRPFSTYGKTPNRE